MDRNKIGIFGDSYAYVSKSGTDDTAWPVILSQKMGMDAEYFAGNGTSIWWSYSKFLQNYENYSSIVFVYSQHNRWHHLSEEAEGMYHLTVPNDYTPVPYPDTQERRNIAKILYSAHRYLHSDEFDLFVYQTIFDNVNMLCKEKNIKIVNILPFEFGEMLIDYSKRQGPVIYNVQNLTTIERSQLSPAQDKQFWEMISSGDKRPCHMSRHHNDLIATVIMENIFTDENKMIDITKDHRTSSDPKLVAPYYENL